MKCHFLLTLHSALPSNREKAWEPSRKNVKGWSRYPYPAECFLFFFFLKFCGKERGGSASTCVLPSGWQTTKFHTHIEQQVHLQYCIEYFNVQVFPEEINWNRVVKTDKNVLPASDTRRLSNTQPDLHQPATVGQKMQIYWQTRRHGETQSSTGKVGLDEGKWQASHSVRFNPGTYCMGLRVGLDAVAVKGS